MCCLLTFIEVRNLSISCSEEWMKKKKYWKRILRKDGISGVFRGAAAFVWLGRGRGEVPSHVRLEHYLRGGQKRTCCAAWEVTKWIFKTTGEKSTDLPSLSLNWCWNWQAERWEACSDSQVEGEALFLKRGKNSYIVRIKNIYRWSCNWILACE